MRNIKSTLLHRWFEEVWNQNQEDAIEQLMTADAVTHGIVAPDQPKGAAGFKIFYRGFREQFDNIHIVVKDVVAQDDMESALTVVTATDRASGKAINFSGICLVRVEAGKIAEAWNHYDFLDMYQQLGQVLMPAEKV